MERDLPDSDFFGIKSRKKVIHEAVGVVAAITPWNFPFMLNLSKIVPALMAGNAVVLKPPPDTPWSHRQQIWPRASNTGESTPKASAASGISISAMHWASSAKTAAVKWRRRFMNSNNSASSG